jgi:hypothetical protein
MFSQTVKTFPEFVNMIEALPLVNGLTLFRGQSVKGNLLPGIARKEPTRDTTAIEKAMLNQLSLLAATLLPAHESSLERLVTAQHFGMKTRLLDWTSNPLAALWFACADASKGDVYVYGLDTDNLLLENAYEQDPFSFTATKIFQPKLNNQRVLAQHGWFTLHCFSPRDKYWVRLETHEIIKNRIIELVIPASERQEMLMSLERHGTSARTLFPDLRGVCEHLNWRHDA